MSITEAALVLTVEHVRSFWKVFRIGNFPYGVTSKTLTQFFYCFPGHVGPRGNVAFWDMALLLLLSQDLVLMGSRCTLIVGGHRWGRGRL